MQNENITTTAPETLDWIDLHCHLDHLKEGVDQAINHARSVGVNKIITIGTEPNDLLPVYQIAAKYYPQVFCTLGIHPHEGAKYTEAAESFILSHAKNKEVVAIGEIGLDYFYHNSSKEEQMVAFEKQMQIAKACQLPVMIHSRDADQDTVAILKKYSNQVKGVIHCFTGSEWFALQAIEMGYNISISGIATFPKAQELRDIVKKIPLENLHVETDAPFLAPVPHRGKPNTSAYMIHTAEVVAGLKGVSLKTLAEQTKINAKKMFNKIIWE